jgi:ATP phosphoribosyltransferase regulatory subunit HisZ
MASLENLKELYTETFALYKSTPMEQTDRKRFTEIFSETKQLKENALKSSTKNSKDYLLKQAHSKLKSVNNELLEIRKANEVLKYQNEVQKLKELFKDKNLSSSEKEYIRKKAGEINNFNLEDWMIYLKNNSKLFGESIGQSINSVFLRGF